MPRVFNQKIKILYLMRVFLERTDEEHPMSVKELIIYLNISTDKRFEKNVKSTTVSSNRTTSKKIGKLKAGKKYYVRICSYKKSCGKNIKGAYSDVKTVITKK